MRLLTAIGAAVLMLLLACGGLFGALTGGAATASCTPKHKVIKLRIVLLCQGRLACEDVDA
jgi:hypothetical protein